MTSRTNGSPSWLIAKERSRGLRPSRPRARVVTLQRRVTSFAHPHHASDQDSRIVRPSPPPPESVGSVLSPPPHRRLPQRRAPPVAREVPGKLLTLSRSPSFFFAYHRRPPQLVARRGCPIQIEQTLSVSVSGLAITPGKNGNSAAGKGRRREPKASASALIVLSSYDFAALNQRGFLPGKYSAPRYVPSGAFGLCHQPSSDTPAF